MSGIITSNDVLNDNYPETAEDKIYLMGYASETEKGYRVDLFSDLPAVWLSDSHREKHNGSDSNPSVGLISCLRTDHPLWSKPCLISSGTFLWTNDEHLVLLKRDEKAPSYAGALTEPCGRCSEFPHITANKELNEEMCVINDDGELVVIQDNDISSYCPHEIKAAQAESKNISYSEFVVEGQSWVPDSIAGELNVVDVFLDDRKVASVHGLSFFDVENNTMEIRRSLIINMSSHDRFIDGEEYNREVHVRTISDLEDEFCTPSLKYLSNIHLKAMENRDEEHSNDA